MSKIRQVRHHLADALEGIRRNINRRHSLNQRSDRDDGHCLVQALQVVQNHLCWTVLDQTTRQRDAVRMMLQQAANHLVVRNRARRVAENFQRIAVAGRLQLRTAHQHRAVRVVEIADDQRERAGALLLRLRVGMRGGGLIMQCFHRLLHLLARLGGNAAAGYSARDGGNGDACALRHVVNRNSSVFHPENLLADHSAGKTCYPDSMGRKLSCSDIIITQTLKENKSLTENK